MNEKLPVIQIFVEALKLPFKRIGLLPISGLPLLIFVLIYIVIAHHNPEIEALRSLSDANLEKDERDKLAHDLLFHGVNYWFVVLVLYQFAFAMSMVSLHRQFLLDNSQSRIVFGFRWIKNTVSYIGWWARVLFCLLPVLLVTVIPLYFLTFILSRFVEPDTAREILDGDIFRNIAACIALFPTMYIMTRWSLVFPSTSINEYGRNLTWSWKQSENNGSRLMLLLFSIPVLVEVVRRMLPDFDSIVADIVYAMVWYVVLAIEVALLSLSYRFFKSQRSTRSQKMI